MEIKTLETKLTRDPTLPAGVWDPTWNDPEIAARIAADAFEQTLFGSEPIGEGQLVAAESLPKYPKKNTEERNFGLAKTRVVEGTDFKGGSYGEIFHRYTYGGTKPAVNFHAQAVIFGADAKGRYLLRARVGRVDGGWGCAAALKIEFVAGGRVLGGLFWEGELDPPKDVEISFKGTDAVLKDSFGALDEVRVQFYSRMG